MKKKIIYGRLLQHIETNNILVEEQFEFRPYASTGKASCSFIEDILNALSNGMMVGGIFATLQKAFNCFIHNI